jgi:hypothetical protein
MAGPGRPWISLLNVPRNLLNSRVITAATKQMVPIPSLECKLFGTGCVKWNLRFLPQEWIDRVRADVDAQLFIQNAEPAKAMDGLNESASLRPLWPTP